jgi:imidazolonepropionase
MIWNELLLGATLACCPENEEGYGTVENGALAFKDGKIAWVGRADDLPGPPHSLAEKVTSVAGKLITPGLIDCHTHVVYGGNRSRDFSLRLHGATYQEIAKQGGGILSTARATASASFDELYSQSLQRVQKMMQHGVTTLEIKSGYGLNFETEVKQLEVIRKIRENVPIQIEATYLALHALPPEYFGRADEYVELVCTKTLPYIAEKRLATSVDAFCETIAFSSEQIERLFTLAKKWGLKIRLHAEQLSNQKGTLLAARYGAAASDHLEFIDEEGILAMAESGMQAVLLPGAFYFLRETQSPPISLFRKYKVPIAIASDSNPGTSPTNNLLLMMNFAAVFWRLTPEECLRGVTIHAACALGLQKSVGSLEIGKEANCVVWNLASPDELSYYIDADYEKIVFAHGSVL